MIQDEPKFPFRGVMLDSSRHFLSMKVLIDQLDLMEMNKFNVFHWHLTDDESFPFHRWAWVLGLPNSRTMFSSEFPRFYYIN